MTRPRPHRPFTLVLAGGGARGAAHVGVLRALEHDGLAPSAIVGVSMGAVVGAAYALNPDWYRAYLAADLARIPGFGPDRGHGRAARLWRLAERGHRLRRLLTRSGALTDAVGTIMEILGELTLHKDLAEARLPFAAAATDLNSGRRVVIREGSAAAAVYASSALAGILPPAPRNGALLADGAYTDVAPIDVARGLAEGVTIVVDPSPGATTPDLRTGLQVLRRSIEVAYRSQAVARFGDADHVITVDLPFPVATTDFGHARSCVAAGVRAVRQRRDELRRLLAPAPVTTAGPGSMRRPSRRGDT